jgi:hypothetical protein
MDKTKKNTKNRSKSNELKSLPAVNSGESTFVLNSDEVSSLVQILAFSKELFMQMSINAADSKDEKSQIIFAARSELSSMLYRKFREIASIGEPTSRELH